MIGSLILEFLWVPPLVGVTSIPTRVSEVRDGLAAAEAETRLTQSGLLTQLGADCSVWKRRDFRLLGTRLVPYGEASKRAFVEIDLSSACVVFDPAEPSTGTSREAAASKCGLLDDFSTFHKNDFSLLFANNTSIDFFADSAEDKREWIDTLESTIARGAAAKAPEWALRLNKLLQAGAPPA